MRRALLAVLVAFPVAGFAVTLGPIEGAPLIGRPLDVAVQVTLDAGQDPDASCARAEVQQGDGASIIATTRVEAPTPARTLLRIRTARPIDEPVVTVTASVGCLQRTTRRYVLLPDLPANAPDVVPPQLAVQVPAVPASVEAVPQARAASQPAARSPRIPRSVTAGAAVPAAGAEMPAPRAPRAAGAANARPQSVVRTSPRSRLRLEPIDTPFDPQLSLRLTRLLGQIPEATPQQIAQAGTAWKALSRTQADVVQDYERMQAMAADLTLMQQHIAATRTELDAMRAQLKKSEDERRQMTWMLSAAVLALLLALAAVLFWRRSESRAAAEKPAWWSDSKLDEEEPAAKKPAPPPAAAEEQQEEPTAELAAQREQDGSLDLDLSNYGLLEDAEPIAPPVATPRPMPRVRDRSNDAPRDGPTSAFSHLDFQASQPSSWRSLTTEELHDIQEQAEFFVSLGDYDRAVSVLMTHVQASPQTSALAWIALLDLHHRLARRQAYEGLREQIERRMNVKVPEFDHYTDPSPGLESYPETMDRIVALWPSPSVVEVIEEAIYPAPGTPPDQIFELAAFDELLLLYNLAQLVASDTDLPDVDLDALPSRSGEAFPMTSIGPLGGDVAGPSDEEMAMLSTLLAGTRVDVNLDEPDHDDHMQTQPIPPEPVRPQDAGGASSNMLDFDAFDEVTSRIRKN